MLASLIPLPFLPHWSKEELLQTLVDWLLTAMSEMTTIDDVADAWFKDNRPKWRENVRAKAQARRRSSPLQETAVGRPVALGRS